MILLRPRRTAAPQIVVPSAWAELTTGPCLQRTFPGGHFFIDEARDLVLDELGRILGETGRDRRVA